MFRERLDLLGVESYDLATIAQYVCVKKKFIWKEWVEKGILRLEHLDSTDTLKSFDDLKQ